MNVLMRSAVRSLVALSAVGLSSVALAGPVSFDVRSTAFTPGSGYGNGSSLLDVDFSANGIRRTFDLLNNGSQTFAFGTVSFNEFDIASAETNNLGVSATFNFDSPLNSNQYVTATGTATVGLANDPGVDLRIDWSDLEVVVGSVKFVISMNDLIFSGNTTLTQNATITLLSGGSPTTTTNGVPEPASLALAGAALLALGVAGRRRRQG